MGLLGVHIAAEIHVTVPIKVSYAQQRIYHEIDSELSS